ncbi:MAG: hypothetical protein M1828_003704 [Chrysothrix sp. TS-e1954]|nr:MAG: hypothetical protein M1828_003704 [Chrysothrix sp. TS-e1954]
MRPFSHTLKPHVLSTRPLTSSTRTLRFQLPLTGTPVATQATRRYAGMAEKAALGVERVSTDKACPVAGPYSQAILAPQGRTLYISGQLPATRTGDLITTSISEKTAACLANVRAILTAADPEASLSNLVKVTVFLSDMGHFAEMNGRYESEFGGHRPSRSCVAVRTLPKGVDVEIEGVAVV